VYSIDTNVISELRKGPRANPGVQRFFDDCEARGERYCLSDITIGELRRGVGLITHRGGVPQAQRLEAWLAELTEQFGDRILSFDTDAAQVWGRLRAPHPENELDKQIAAIAHIHGLRAVTRNVADFQGCAVEAVNPFEDAGR
jgi:predicted nucleic acid-binding protein